MSVTPPARLVTGSELALRGKTEKWWTVSISAPLSWKTAAFHSAVNYDTGNGNGMLLLSER